MPEMKN